MGRRTPSYILEDRLAKARAREQYYANKNLNDDTFNATRQETPRMRVGYRSLTKKVGATPTHARLAIIASETACKFFEGVGTTGNLGAGNVNLGLEYVDLTEFIQVTKWNPSRVKATLGTGTPTPARTAWGTRYIKYTESGAGNARASYTAPISEKTGDFTLADLETTLEALSNISGIATAIGEYGRLWLEPESEPIIAAIG